ncbi:hypothetical protein [Companilactobacillus jidongensis]|uniref:hypothetical protein n=1 Tax=Companilactobacillus jidongensis TaxID=2486006 RepID=UPI000F798F5A|nr:hypothetical protein [Companilactobacillus jidongensis]
MSNVTYYSVMKNDSLIQPWTKSSREIIQTLKLDSQGVLISLKGDAKTSLDDLIDIGKLSIYDQQTMDQFMNEKTCGDVYLDNAFTLIDDLEMKYGVKDTKYSFEIYLATALAKKMQISQKLSWILMTAFIATQSSKLADLVLDYPGDDWKQFDSSFFDKLLEKPYTPPFVEQDKHYETYFKSELFEYNLVAKAFQDLNELRKINNNRLSLKKLQNQHSFELIRMSFELLKYFS